MDEATKLAHVKNIEEKYKQNESNKMESKQELPKEESIVETPASEVVSDANEVIDSDNTASEQLICPRCGRELVKRVAKKGENAGKEFYGCSGFPKCRYII